MADKLRFKDRCGAVQVYAVKPSVFVDIWFSLKSIVDVTRLCARDPQAKKAVSAMGVWTPQEGSLYPLHSNKRI